MAPRHWDDIVAKAREEGEVIVYSSSGRIAKLVDDFNAHYPEMSPLPWLSIAPPLTLA
jgi:iron(III) transport system substrate-binding protein